MPPHPRYDFPRLRDLALALLVLAGIAALGVTLAGTDIAQSMARGNTATQKVQP